MEERGIQRDHYLVHHLIAAPMMQGIPLRVRSDHNYAKNVTEEATRPSQIRFHLDTTSKSLSWSNDAETEWECHSSIKAREEAPKATPKVASVPLQKWCWGLMSLPMLQPLASSAVEDRIEQPSFSRTFCM